MPFFSRLFLAFALRLSRWNPNSPCLIYCNLDARCLRGNPCTGALNSPIAVFHPSHPSTSLSLRILTLVKFHGGQPYKTDRPTSIIPRSTAAVDRSSYGTHRSIQKDTKTLVRAPPMSFRDVGDLATFLRGLWAPWLSSFNNYEMSTVVTRIFYSHICHLMWKDCSGF